MMNVSCNRYVPYCLGSRGRNNYEPQNWFIIGEVVIRCRAFVNEDEGGTKNVLEIRLDLAA